ncbi:glucose-1-phosphate cytidylyltransferase [Candidatus Formimonas warabiya]|uniref:Glucose-1-phosphate cytidylyltransferase n=1 Tax=Formimonas warabiya TaxID=1761012 RepID=A0A3G1KT24_FORW1|nr:glucose-1-phosphate cytidylyltransferase [Candidatus Formimonas warabiya]ATW25673.1 glucose-1-phosphate cytidylyltransferase [Candidatus Formimonas warabiya]
MKVVLLAGGFGTRISEESYLKPKPMIEIGDRPILWHIMKLYSHYGYNDFIICVGYKGYIIKEFFADYFLHMSDVTFDLKNNIMKIHCNHSEPWTVTLVDTGLDTMTGGRLKRIKDYVSDESFLLTYGDGVCNVNVNELVEFHKAHGKMVTLTAIQPEGRFGMLHISDENSIDRFKEKIKEDSGWINGGFMVCQPEIMDYIEGDATVLEKEPMETIARMGQLKAYKHAGFWQCMDTLRDKNLLDELWKSGEAPWKVWE